MTFALMTSHYYFYIMPAIDVIESDVEDLFYHMIHKINRHLDGTITIDELQDNLWEILTDLFSELVK